MEDGISPEPELYKCNTIPILVNIAKIVLTTWISFLCHIVDGPEESLPTGGGWVDRMDGPLLEQPVL